MKNNKKIYLFIIILILLAFISFFGKSYVEEKNFEIKELKSIIINKENTIESKNKEILTIQREYFKLEDKFKNYKESQSKEIIEKKNKDGSSVKIVKINNNKESTSSNNNKTYIKDNINKENSNSYKENTKESIEQKEKNKIKKNEYKKVESGLKPLLYIGGGILLCILSGICGV